MKNAINVGYLIFVAQKYLNYTIFPCSQNLFKIFYYLPFIDECQVDDDCPYTKRCKNNECQDPCPDIICGTRAICKAEAHRAVCECPPGLQGNPLVACTEAGCTSNFECSGDEKCDYLTASSSRKECQPLCRNNPCATGASCTASNHREICTCNYPLQGDGYVSCTEIRIPDEPECRVDQDCQTKLACIDKSCQNPCRVNNPCTGEQTCVVKDTLPTRTVACVCPEGTVFSGRGSCQRGNDTFPFFILYDISLKIIFKISSDQKSIFKFELYALVEVKAECYVDDDCATSDICNKGSCVDACRLSHCGSNAICEAGYHSAKCVCLPGFTGDPRTACNKCKLDFHKLEVFVRIRNVRLSSE